MHLNVYWGNNVLMNPIDMIGNIDSIVTSYFCTFK
jgi:hypothetical protein